MSRRAFLSLGILLILPATLATGCSTRVSTTGTMPPAGAGLGSSLPRPRRVLVQDFVTAPDAIRLDQAIGLRLQRQASGQSEDAGRAEVAIKVQDAISSTLAAAFRKMDFTVEHAGPETRPAPGDLLVQGEVTRIDQGNRARRLAVGFGAGKSEVDADAAISLYGVGGQPQTLQTYSGSSNSGRKPGMAAGAGMAVGEGSMVPAALGAAAGAHGEKKRAGVAGEGQRVAEHLARNIGQYFAQQGWIAPSAVPAWSLR